MKRTLKKIYPDYSKNIIENKGLDNIIKELKILHKNNKLDFPYKKFNMTEDSIKQRFNRLSTYKHTIINFDYEFKFPFKLPDKLLLYEDKKMVLVFEPNDYHNYNLISDYFQEEPRMKCLRSGRDDTPYEFYNKYLDKVIKEAYSQFNHINSHTMREAIFKLTSECSTFRPTVLLAIINMFNSKVLLDISAGWGDRLIGAMAANVDFYFGADPNPDLHDGYKKMIHFFERDPENFIIENSTFETANIPKKDYDLIMTSPPYFKTEKYRDDEKQSIFNRDLSKWLEEFMYVSLKKAWKHLIIGGYLVLNIHNSGKGNHYVEPIINYVNKFIDAKYLGLISYGEFRNLSEDKKILRQPQPLWIWRKIDKKYIGGNIYNPEIFVKPIEFNIVTNTTRKKIKVNIIREDMLEAGTKQRAMIPYLQNHKSKEFVYVSPYTGGAQIALGYASKITGKKITIFINKRNPKHPLTLKALSYGVLNIIEVEKANFKKLNKMADEYVKKIIKDKDEEYITLFNLGFADKEYINLLSNQIKKALPKSIKKNHPKRLWIPAGSTALLNSLYSVFPETHFLAVQVGKTIWDDMIDLNRTTLYKSEEFFYDIAKEQPPYPTTKSYDAKLWTFVKKYGKSDDYIWNVTKDPNPNDYKQTGSSKIIYTRKIKDINDSSQESYYNKKQKLIKKIKKQLKGGAFKINNKFEITNDNYINYLKKIKKFPLYKIKEIYRLFSTNYE